MDIGSITCYGRNQWHPDSKFTEWEFNIYEKSPRNMKSEKQKTGYYLVGRVRKCYWCGSIRYFYF